MWRIVRRVAAAQRLLLAEALAFAAYLQQHHCDVQMEHSASWDPTTAFESLGGFTTSLGIRYVVGRITGKTRDDDYCSDCLRVWKDSVAVIIGELEGVEKEI